MLDATLVRPEGHHEVLASSLSSELPFCLTAQELAAILRKPRSWVYQHKAAIGFVRIGGSVRFTRPQVLAYLAAQSSKSVDG